MKLGIKIDRQSLHRIIGLSCLVLIVSALVLGGFLYAALKSPHRKEPVVVKQTQRAGAAAPVQKEIEPVKPELIIIGVCIGRKSLVVIRDPKKNEDYYCEPGDSIGEYKVLQIFRDKVTLDSGGEIIEITR